jgi:hypothetical protein
MIRVVQLSRFITVASVAITLLVLTGCGNKIANNFSQVKTGMSPKQVEDLLGAPKESAEIDMGAAFKEVGKDLPKVGGIDMPGIDINITLPKISVKYWEEGDKGYVVHFQNDKVTQTFSGTKDDMKGKMKKG